MSDIEGLKELLAKTPCETLGAEDLEPGCCGPCRARAELAYFQSKLAEAERALEFYADPETYHACAFYFDPPTGGFDDDFDEDHGHEDYDRPMPGKLARTTLATIREEEPLPKQGE